MWVGIFDVSDDWRSDNRRSTLLFQTIRKVQLLWGSFCFENISSDSQKNVIHLLKFNAKLNWWAILKTSKWSGVNRKEFFGFTEVYFVSGNLNNTVYSPLTKHYSTDLLIGLHEEMNTKFIFFERICNNFCLIWNAVHPFSCLSNRGLDCLTRKMKALWPLRTSGYFHPVTQVCIPADWFFKFIGYFWCCSNSRAIVIKPKFVPRADRKKLVLRLLLYG